ncbi:Acid alpha-amylase [Colletotrichum tanaceti]|uniref:alpha-amylase n=1 Tax=Colletotrichum tanaceti TaxID=1306861 RepID=A0A4U6XJT4_9PEZI|nr:Acid alpha-amylase [Colletotrichum tanaceti]TKW55722.1 Acid alpha-amylase [Colletotrichum tanaceti]
MRSLTPSLSLLATAALRGASALDAAGWRNQSIYQIITDRFATSDGSAPACDTTPGLYCGGTWKGITSKLDYIQNLGATAVWISPVVKNVEGNINGYGEGYHGFWTEDLYSLNPHFGTEADLKGLADALHARGMYLMIDVAPNHVGLNDDPGNYAKYKPFDGPEYYHEECPIAWNNITSEQLCWLEGLPDLRTEDARVRRVYASWIRDLVAEYAIDGLRVDTALEIEPEFFSEGGFREAAGVFLLAEVSHSSLDLLAPYQGVLDGILDYAGFHSASPAFGETEGDLEALYKSINAMADTAGIDPSVWGSFVENQDQVRFAHRNGDVALAKNLYALVMLRDGIPVVYYGQEQHLDGGANPHNREALWLAGYDVHSELYGWIQQTNKVRARAAASNADFLTRERTRAVFSYGGGGVGRDNSSSRVLALRKGQLFSMYTNGGVGAANDVSFAIARNVHGFAADSDVVDVMNCESFRVASHGRLWVQMPDGGLPRVFLPAEQAEGLCNDVKAPRASATVKVGVDKNTGYNKRSVPFVATVLE